MHRLMAIKDEQGNSMAPNVIPNDWEIKVINELRRAIIRSVVIRSGSVSDAYNPDDRHLEFYAGLRMKNIDPRYGDLIAKMLVGCRLSANGTLSIRTIDRQFEVE